MLRSILILTMIDILVGSLYLIRLDFIRLLNKVHTLPDLSNARQKPSRMVLLLRVKDLKYSIYKRKVGISLPKMIN